MNVKTGDLDTLSGLGFILDFYFHTRK